jgi:hypothetical protein
LRPGILDMSDKVRRNEATEEFGRSSDRDRRRGGIRATPHTTARIRRTRGFMRGTSWL